MRRTGYILILDLFLLALCVAGVYRIALKAKFPAEIAENGNAVVIKNISFQTHSDLRNGDTLITISEQIIHSDDEIEFLCNGYHIGDSVFVQLVRNGKNMTLSVPLEKDYSTIKIIIESFVGLIFFLIGIVVVLLQRKEKSARIFHYLCVSIAALILLTSGCYIISPLGLGYILEIIFQTSYLLVPVLFLHFTLVFPTEKFANKKKILIALYLTVIILSVWAALAFLHTAYPKIDLQKFAAYSSAYTVIQTFFVLLFFLGFVNIIHSYRITKQDSERRKLRWIFFGIVLGASAFISLWLVPRVLIGTGILSEEFVLLLSIIAPLSFAIAIVRFRVFDIDLLFKRSTVYAIVISVLFILYIGIVNLLSSIARSYNFPSLVADSIAALLIALLFEPLRKRMQKIIDKKFFRVSYDVLRAQHGFLEEIKFVITKTELANLVIERTNSVLPVTKNGFFVVDSSNDKLRLIAHKGFEVLERHNVTLEKEELKTALEQPIALEGKIEPGIPFEFADSKMFGRWGIALVFPMLSSEREILGFLVLGEKQSGLRFSIEDISLLTLVTTQAGFALERLSAQHALNLEQAESERLTELNQLKSYFVSSVSHDLKTPLTSIRLFAELLREKEDLPRAKANEYLSIIEGEADRLSRLITNVLDFAKIEKGTKEYNFQSVDLNSIVQSVIHSLEYQINSKGFSINTQLYLFPLLIRGDSDAISDAITNLITNGMKYSPADRKKITISTSHENDYAIVKVEDEGYGIADIELVHIFEPFYRIDDSVMKSAGGAGLGLSLVKHTMAGHQGKVEVTSEVGKGSIFVLYFPFISESI